MSETIRFYRTFSADSSESHFSQCMDSAECHGVTSHETVVDSTIELIGNGPKESHLTAGAGDSIQSSMCSCVWA